MSKDLHRLVPALNSLTSIQILTLEFRHNFSYSNDVLKTIDLPVIGRLKEFYIDVLDPEIFYESLLKYAKPNEQLNKLGLSCINTYNFAEGFFRQEPSQFYQKFVSFPFMEYLQPNNEMQLYCKQFCSLQNLNIIFHSDQELYQMVRLMQPLKQCTQLRMSTARVYDKYFVSIFN